MDFNKLENIIFVSVVGVLALFLLVMTFYVISKGRRKTSGLDIFIRILAVIVLIASAGLVALAVFTDLGGGFRIAVTGDKAVFIAGGSATELPLGVLFATLSSAVGHAIAVGLFLISLMALVSDCLLAKRKYGKKKDAVKKTPEQIKRDAELEKIRKLSDAAVRKTSSAAEKSDVKAEKKPEVQNDVEHESEQPAAEEEPSFDWRVETPKTSNEFVGISHSQNTDADFDSFDDFDAGDDGERENADGLQDVPNEDAQAEYKNQDHGFSDVTENSYGEQSEPEPEPAHDEKPWYEQDSPADERIIAEALSDEPAQQNTPLADELASPIDEDVNDIEAFDEDELADEPYGQDVQDERYENYEQPEKYEQDERDEYEPDVNDVRERQDEYEPDRNIYIPGIRTVTRTPRVARPAPAPAPEKASDKKRSAKPTAVKAQKQRKPAAQKRSANAAKATEPSKSSKPTAVKAQTEKKPAKAVKPQKKTVDPRKLPVTRRYVILDRTNAVNIFSNYLKEREKAEKDKLESSINTIIIK